MLVLVIMKELPQVDDIMGNLCGNPRVSYDSPFFIHFSFACTQLIILTWKYENRFGMCLLVFLLMCRKNSMILLFLILASILSMSIAVNHLMDCRKYWRPCSSRLRWLKKAFNFDIELLIQYLYLWEICVWPSWE